MRGFGQYRRDQNRNDPQRFGKGVKDLIKMIALLSGSFASRQGRSLKAAVATMLVALRRQLRVDLKVSIAEMEYSCVID